MFVELFYDITKRNNFLDNITDKEVKPVPKKHEIVFKTNINVDQIRDISNDTALNKCGAKFRYVGLVCSSALGGSLGAAEYYMILNEVAEKLLKM